MPSIELYVWESYEQLPASDKAAWVAERELNRTIDAEVDLCFWAIPGDCDPLVNNGHRPDLEPEAIARKITNSVTEYQREGRVRMGDEVAAIQACKEGKVCNGKCSFCVT